MLQYILECIAFQLVFLIIYDVFLKRETFFQWNRLYLIGTYIISMVLPWIKIEAMKTTVPESFQAYPEFLWNRNDTEVIASTAKEAPFSISWEYALFFGGMLLAALFFGYKLYQIYALRRKGEVHYFKDFTRIVIANSSIAFSFFKSIFLGDKVIEKEHENILQHELVHIRQRHSYDLMFFELMRVVGWFNPLVYVYQSRISELHEFIADAHVAKTDKKEQYELLLSEVFQTHHISFINQFFKTSLIKKRIVMLTKEKSKQVFKLKYALLFPVVLGMLFYTSCDLDESKGDQVEIDAITVADIENLSVEEENLVYTKLQELSENKKDWSLIVRDQETTLKFEDTEENKYISGTNNERIRAQLSIDFKDSQKLFKNFMAFDEDKFKRDYGIPFATVDEVPIFPGCENEIDQRACFNKMIQKHISKNFRYPQEAQEQGIQGRVSTMFIISEDGTIQNLKMRGPNHLLEDEVARIISRLPKMIPGKQDGRAVRVPFSIPISFKLEQAGFGNFSGKSGVEESEMLSKVLFDGVYGDIIPFSKVDEVPIFPECEGDFDQKACFQKSIQRHIGKNFRYPQEAQEKGIQGRVAVMFIIAKDGSIKGLKTRGPDQLLEKEAVRIISSLPKLNPAKHNGEIAEVVFSIPITFKLK